MTDGERTGDRVPLYDQLSAEYDVMVAWSERLRAESPFLADVVRRAQATRLLDVGCGTGWHAIHFARLGLQSVGADPSGEMVRRARENARGTVGVRFVQAGLGQLQATTEGKFDVVTCLGNTLPHLLDEDALRQGLADVAAVLRAGGYLVVQQLNYDRLLASRQRFLGVSAGQHEGQEMLFFRFYDYEGALLTFNVVTLRKEAGRWGFQVRATRLQPIQSSQLVRLLAEAGFGRPELYGSFDRTAYQPQEANDLIVVATRL